MSTVQLAVKKVKGLSDNQAQALLDWLSQQESRPRATKKTAPPRRKQKRKQTMADLMAWYDSIRGTTDWEPPRMPNDLVQRVNL
jgi:cytochrome c553